MLLSSVLPVLVTFTGAVSAQIRIDSFNTSAYKTIQIYPPDQCDDDESVNCTTRFFAPVLQTISYLDIDGEAVIYGDINAGPIANLLALQSDGNQVAGGQEPDSTKRSISILASTTVGFWPSAILKYRYESQATKNMLDSDVLAAMQNWKQVAPFLQFVEQPLPKAGDNGGKGVLTIKVANGICRCNLGYYANAPMDLFLMPYSPITGGCSLHNIVHELGHGLGLLHEQQRPDRQASGIDYKCENIQKLPTSKADRCTNPANADPLQHNFDTNSNADYAAKDNPYDRLSILHYHNTAFGASDGKGGLLETLPGAQTYNELFALVYPSIGDTRQVCKIYNAQCALTGWCGDGKVQVGEECDKGDRFNGDGCSEICKKEPFCGDGIIQKDRGEECDDGNTVNGDGCSSICRKESICGDGIIQPGEECDDGNKVSGDGCSSTCKKEMPTMPNLPCTNGTNGTCPSKDPTTNPLPVPIPVPEGDPNCQKNGTCTIPTPYNPSNPKITITVVEACTLGCNGRKSITVVRTVTATTSCATDIGAGSTPVGPQTQTPKPEVAGVTTLFPTTAKPTTTAFSSGGMPSKVPTATTTGGTLQFTGAAAQHKEIWIGALAMPLAGLLVLAL